VSSAEPAETAEKPPRHVQPDPLPAPLPPATGPVQPEGEINGPKGPEPTRYGDWEKGGRVSDF
jgi:hypothetical protein